MARGVNVGVGFIGLGTMGAPMAHNLLRAGLPLVVWNRTAARCAPFATAGAQVADTVEDLFAQCPIVMLMLADGPALDEVLSRGTPAFAARVTGKVVVNLGTTSAEHSTRLEREIVQAGGRYVEAPVSGSRVPAEQGTLVGMLAGRAETVAEVRQLLEPLCASVFDCGAVPNALRTKLAVNHYLIAMVAALTETFHASRAAGVELRTLQKVLDAGPMASEVSRLKFDKLLRGDYRAQASVRDAGTIARLSLGQALAAGAATPLLERCVDLYRVAEQSGKGDHDMIAAAP